VSDAREAEAAVTEDAFLGGRLRILQPKRGHRAGLDALLLAAAAPLKAGRAESVLDVGAGVGVVGLAVACRVDDAHVTLIDNNPDLVELARANIARNGLASRVRALAVDVARPLSDAGLERESFDHVLANPPYHVEGRGTAAHSARRGARMMGAGGVERWVRFMAAMVRAKGTATLIYPASGLGEVLEAFGRRFGGLRLLPLYPREKEPANLILVQGIKGSRAPLEVKPGLVLHDLGHCFRPELEGILREGAALSLAGES
jgi:tRNA1(Val) A37 N6-methylase TrmN6